uniref:Uncharacterized protein n=1 Tax=Arundo donax TaxID=35708 RepID=A0A0A9B9A1_ARUDO
MLAGPGISRGVSPNLSQMLLKANSNSNISFVEIFTRAAWRFWK